MESKTMQLLEDNMGEYNKMPMWVKVSQPGHKMC